MMNEQAVTIRKAVTAIGVGLLEEALEREGRKGCSPIVSKDPVGLEPDYERFDAARILHRGATFRGEAQAAPPEQFVTLDVYAAEEDQLSITWMETALRALSVLRSPVAFELFGHGGTVWFRFAVVEEELVGLRTALLGHFPALELRVVEDPFPDSSPVAVNELVPVAPYHRSLTLLGKEGASPLGLAVVALSELKQGAGLFQVLLQPASPFHDWHFNVENLVDAELKAKQLSLLGGLSSDFSYDRWLPPLLDAGAVEKVRVDVGFYAALVRYAVWDTDPVDARAFLQAMRVATGMLRFGNRSWRVIRHGKLVEALGVEGVRDMVTNRLAHRPGVMLTSREAASLVHIANARTLAMLASIEQRRGFRWTPVDVDGESGPGSACLGLNVFAGETRPVVVPIERRLRHMYVAGVTGSGKSKLVERLAVDDAYAGLGFCLVDPHGDLCMDVLSRIPRERMRDLVYVSFAEPGFVPRWNPFAANTPPGKLADDMARALLAQASVSGARMEHNFRMLAYVTTALNGTLDDFAEMAERSQRGELLRERALETIQNPQVQRFLRNELSRYSNRDLFSVTNKLSRLLLDDNLGAMFRQPENQLDPRQWMDESRIVLVNLASGEIGTDHACFVGSLLVSLIYRAALTRADTPPDQRTPFILYIDEFQLLQAATLPELLSEGRKYRIGTVLAHQERGQLGKELAQSLSNCATKVVFRPGEDDLPYFHRVLGTRVDADALRALGVGEALLAFGSHVASLTTELTRQPRLHDPRDLAREYTHEHYTPVADAPLGAPVRRPRVYDTFGPARAEE